MGRKERQTTILVVDDEQVHRYMLCSMLREWGWRCVEADDGETGVAAVEKHTYDAVLMDVRMARMDGREAFSRIHALQPSLPVVIMTAYSSVDDAVAAIRHGAHDYLTKPLDPDQLPILQHLHMVLRRLGVLGQDLRDLLGGHAEILRHLMHSVFVSNITQI